MTYVDSGFVVSLYRPEATSAAARREIKKATAPVFLSPLSLLEIRNAFNMAIARQEMNAFERDAVMKNIEEQTATGFFRMVTVSQAAIYEKAAKLSDQYTSPLLTHSLDLMHVATALLCHASLFLSTDTRQRKVAKAEGLKVKPA